MSIDIRCSVDGRFYGNGHPCSGWPFSESTRRYLYLTYTSSIFPPAITSTIAIALRIAATGRWRLPPSAPRVPPARAMTASSGPGLSLYSENVGLAIMGEVPMVIVDVQRQGPAPGSARYDSNVNAA